MATQILVMRHAEKPDDAKDPDLTPAGRRRAEALATYIPTTFGTPDFVFAAAISKRSARPYETLKPLSKATGVPIDSTWADQDYAALAEELRQDPKFRDKRIVVCWHHGNIPNLLHALKAAHGQYPDPWPRDTFDLILRVTADGGAVAVASIREPF
jgi:broad specificity phosphatase PhoE